MLRCCCGILLSIGVFLGQVWSSEWLKPNFHGFISQTFLKTTKRDFLIKDSSRGSFQYSEMGLNISGAPEARYRYSLQTLFREFGEEGDFEPTLDFGFFDARVTEQFGVRVGKVRMPLGSQNEFRDVDPGRITLLPQQSVYPESFRPLMISVLGLDVYGHKELSGFGEANVRLFGGSIGIRDDFFFTQRIRSSFNSPNTEIDGRRVGGAWLGWESPDGNFLAHASFALMSGSISLETSDMFSGNLAVTVPVTMDKAFSLDVATYIYGFEYRRGDWCLSAEYNHFQPSTKYSEDLKNQVVGVIGGPFPLGDEVVNGSDDSYAWYLELTYDHPGPLGGAISYSDYISNKARPSSDPSNHREAITFSLRYDVSEHLIAKAEFHRFSGRAAFKTFATNNNSDENWTLSAFRMSYSF